MRIRLLTHELFAPFGDLIEANTLARQYTINHGLTTRFHDLAQIDTAQQGGKTGVSIFRSQPLPLPLELTVMERHPLGSQLFMPLSDTPYLVVVARAGDFNPAGIEVFFAQGGQGVNYRAGTWHHFSLALYKPSDFLVIDRIGSGHNCDEVQLPEALIIRTEDLPA